MYYEPDVYDILKYKHNYTDTGEYVLTSYFIPTYEIIVEDGFIDKRGWVDPEKGKEFYNKRRQKKANDPKALIIECAEYCFTAEEAFSLEGENKFNKNIIAEQLANIRLHKIGPKVEVGNLSYVYKNGIHTKENLIGFRWDESMSGKVHILEHPVWSDLYKESLDEERDYSEMNNLYVAGIDSIDIGANETSVNTDDPSKFCIVIKKRAFGLDEPKYVAYYKDRPNDIREAYKIAMCLALYYKAIINIEATRVSMLTWAKSNGFYKYFMARPRATYPNLQAPQKRTYIGTPATPAIINHQTDLIADYVEDYGHTIWFDEMLDELNRYTDENKRKFDIVASLGMAELADEELGSVVPSKIIKEEDIVTTQKVGYYTDENGYKRWGVIPMANNNLKSTWIPIEGPRSSDPRKWTINE